MMSQSVPNLSNLSMSNSVNLTDVPKSNTDLTTELNYDKIIKLFTSVDTCSLFERQVAQLRRVSRHNPSGFVMSQLPQIQSIMLLSLSRLNEGKIEFEKPLCSLIALSGVPFVRQISNEELLLAGLNAVESLYRALTVVMGTALSLTVRAEAASALREIGKGKVETKTKSNQPADIKVMGGAGGIVKNDQRPKPRDLNQAMLSKANVVVGCVDELKKTSDSMILSLAAKLEASRGESENFGYLSDEDSDSDTDDFHPQKRQQQQQDNDETSPQSPTTTTTTNLTTQSPRGLLTSLLKLLLELSESSSNSVSIILNNGDSVIINIMKHLNDERDETLNICVEILWNCLEHSAETVENGEPSPSRSAIVENAMHFLSNNESVGVLCVVFRELIQRGFRNKDKELRNEILILSSLIAKASKTHTSFLETDFVKTMCIYATVAEVGLDPTPDITGFDEEYANPHHYATISPADIEMKRILWGLLSELARFDERLLEVLLESPLIETLLMYLDADVDDGDGDGGLFDDAPEYVGENNDNNDDNDVYDTLPPPPHSGESKNNNNNNNNIIDRIPRTQLRVLQQQAMAVLLNLAPRAPYKFCSLGGHVITLKFLDWCGGESVANRELVQGALMLIISVVGFPGLPEELAKLDAIRIMIGLFNDKSAPDSLRTDAVRIISRLCADNGENQETFRRASGISFLVGEISEYTKQRRVICGKPVKASIGRPVVVKNDGDDDEGGTMMGGNAKEKLSPLVIGVVDCIWNAAVGNRRSEARFLQGEGQMALLDLLELSPTLMRHQIIGVLADLARNSGSIPYLTAWRSDRSMVSAVQLLMQLWEEEESRLKVERADGVVNNLWKPLGKHHVGEAVPSRPVDYFNEYGKTEMVEEFGEVGEGGEVVEGILNGVIDEDEPQQHLPTRTTTLLAFKKLENALQAGSKSNGGSLEALLKKSMAAEDYRGKIACFVALVDFENAKVGLSAHEKMVLVMVQNWLPFKHAEEWASVRDTLVAESVKPIKADALLIGSHLEEAFNCAEAVNQEQGVLHTQRDAAVRAEEAAFFGSILLQRDQEINLLMIKKKASMPKSLNKRKAEKEAKAAMLAKSLVRGAAEGGGEGGEGEGEIRVVVEDEEEEKKE